MVKRENRLGVLQETSTMTPVTSPSSTVMETAAGLQQTAQSSINWTVPSSAVSIWIAKDSPHCGHSIRISSIQSMGRPVWAFQDAISIRFASFQRSSRPYTGLLSRWKMCTMTEP